MNKSRVLISLLLSAMFIAAAEGQTLIDMRTQAKDWAFSGSQMGVALPVICTVGQLFFVTTAPTGSNIYACNPTNVWTPQGTGLSATAGTANQMVASNGSSFTWLSLAGDLSGAPNSLKVTGLQGRALSSTPPAGGQALAWSTSTSTWQPAGAGGDLGGTLTSATVTGIQSRPVANTAPANGQALVWNSAASNWQPSAVGAISSVFGRNGSITAQSGDYSFSQISGSVASSQLPAADGDLSGSLTAARVGGLQGRPVASTAPANGQGLVWSGSTGQWQPGAVSGGMASQLGDLAVTYFSSTVLSIGAGCTPTTPCAVRFGYQVYSITGAATATLSGTGTGTAFIYANSSGSLIVGHNLTVACAGCIQQAGVTSFPANVIPICTWTATSGTWDNTGGRDQRSFLSAKALAGGQGIVVTETPAQSILAIDSSIIPTYLTNTATLSFPSVAVGACAPDQAITVTGANTGDAVEPGWPAGLPAGLLGIMLVSNTNTVTVRLCNMAASAVQPPSLTYRATIVRNY